MNLISKLALATGIVLLGTMALFAYLNFRNLKGLMLEDAIDRADRITETIIRTTRDQMLWDNRPLYYRTIAEMGTQQGVELIRLINKSGRIIFSTRQEEIGTLIDKRSEICSACHGGPHLQVTASSKSRSRRYLSPSGSELLGISNAIYNEESCFTASCHFHPEMVRVLGLLDVVVPLDGMRSLLDAYRNRSVALTFLLLLLTTICLTYFTQRLVNRPVRELLEHTQKLSRGELDGLVHTFAKDEIGELAEGFNTMTLNLKKARLDLERWGRDLEEMVQQRTTELINMQAQLVRSEKLASLGELVAGIAHEINNPLTGILVYSSLIQSNPQLSQELRNDIETVLKETKRCAGIVKGLLKFARCSTPRKGLCSLSDVADQALALIEHQILFQDISVVRRYDADLPQLLLDSDQIEQVLVNIFVNAGHAMDGNGDLTVTTGMSEKGIAFISIRDNGHGIAEAHLSKIFDPFFTTKANKGTGLGLSVSYGIIQEHGGQIDVVSQEGSGTTFTVRLPVGDRPVDAQPPPPTP